LDDTARRQQMDRARRSIEAKCDWDICLPQFTLLLSDIVKNS